MMTAQTKASPLFVVLLLFGSVAAVVAAVVIYETVSTQRLDQVLPEASVATPVRVATIERRPIDRRAAFHGFLAPFEQLSLSADVPGEVTEQRVEVSDRVEQGAVLFRIDDAARKLDHDRAQAVLDRMTNEFELAGANWDHIRSLPEVQVTSIERKQAETSYLAAQAAVREAEAAVRIASLQLEKTGVTSPIDGVVSAILLRRGEFAQPGQPVATVIEVDRLKLLAEVSDRDMVWMKVSDPALLTTHTMPGTEFAGTVYRIHPQAIPTSHRFMVEIVLSNADGRLRPGLFMRGDIFDADASAAHERTPSVLVIPCEAVVEQYGRQFCFVVRADGGASCDVGAECVAFRTVVSALPHPSDPRVLRVVSGVTEGDAVVTKGIQHLSDETTVRITD